MLRLQEEAKKEDSDDEDLTDDNTRLEIGCHAYPSDRCFAEHSEGNLDFNSY